MWGTLDDRERAARKAVLNLIREGKAPDADLLAVDLRCPRTDAGHLLDALVAKGFVVRDGARGAIVAAYPLSVRPTRHRVTLGSGQAVYALCAMDALGISPLVGLGAAIESRCPHCERAIRLEVREGEIRGRDPSTAVLWYSMADLLEKRVEGLNLAAKHWPTTNFFCTEEAAWAWAEAHGQVDGTVLSWERAMERAREVFGAFWSPTGWPEGRPMPGTKGRWLLRLGVVGTVLTCLACFTPAAVALLGLLGLAGWTGYLDYVLFPLLGLFLILLGCRYWQRQHRKPADGA